MTTQLTVESRREEPNLAVLSLLGEVDVANVAQVREEALRLLAAGVKGLVVDLGGVEYMDSSGLGMLVGLQKRMREADGKLALASPRPRVERLLDITGLARIFAVYEDVEGALKEVAG